LIATFDFPPFVLFVSWFVSLQAVQQKKYSTSRHERWRIGRFPESASVVNGKNGNKKDVHDPKLIVVQVDVDFSLFGAAVSARPLRSVAWREGRKLRRRKIKVGQKKTKQKNRTKGESYKGPLRRIHAASRTHALQGTRTERSWPGFGHIDGANSFHEVH
jgi:hypothetical protein